VLPSLGNFVNAQNDDGSVRMSEHLLKYCEVVDESDNGQRAVCYDYWADNREKYNARQNFTGERIDLFDSTINVNEDATISVREGIIYNFDKMERHGIYRDIPVKYKTKAGGTFRLNINNITVTDENFTKYPFTISDMGSSQRIKIGDPNETVTGIHKYIISYTVDRPIGFFEDFDEIYWNGTGNEWPVPIAEARVKVVLPKFFNKEELNRIACYWGSIGSTQKCEWEVVDSVNGLSKGQYNAVQFYSSKSLLPHEGITVAVGFPKGVVDASKAPSTLEKIFGNVIYDGWIWFLIPIILFIFLYQYWSRNGRDPKGTGIIIPQYNTPDNLSPMQIAYVLNKSFGDSLSGEIVYLATKGYIKINHITKKVLFVSTDDYEIVKVKNYDNNLKPFQIKLLDRLFTFAKGGKDGAIGSKVEISDLVNKFYAINNEIEKEVEETLVIDGYFPGAKYGGLHSPSGRGIAKRIATALGTSLLFLFFVGPMGLTAFGPLFVVILALSAVICSVFYVIMPRMTEKGTATMEYIKGFKMYLSVAEKDRLDFHNAPEKNPETFEKFLPYAIALGVSDKWAKVFEGMSMQNPSWYSDSSGHTFSMMAFSSSMSNFSHTATRSFASAPGSSSGSGGGGFSGGGGGGGGGGSW
jgi:hypothetical protein